jgi:hypothetical protein
MIKILLAVVILMQIATWLAVFELKESFAGEINSAFEKNLEVIE